MNRSSKQYYRKLTTNAYNQDFIYYKQLHQHSKSPKFKKHIKSHHQTYQNQTNHSKIQSMKNTLNTLFQPSASKVITRTFNKSVMQHPTYDAMKNHQMSVNPKSVYNNQTNNNIRNNASLNNKLEMLTEKLRRIAQKPYFGALNDEIKIVKSKNVMPAKSQHGLYAKNPSMINKLNHEDQHVKLEQLFQKPNPKIYHKGYQNMMENGKNQNHRFLNSYSQQLVKNKSKSSSSFFQKNKADLMGSSTSQRGSLKRQPKLQRNDKSVFYNPSESYSKTLEISKRSRGQSIISNLVNTPVDMIDRQVSKIKINSYLQSKQSQRKTSTRNLAGAFSQFSQNKQANTSKIPVNSKILTPHRGPITSIIINSDGKRFLTASNDYTVKESTIQQKCVTLRKHQGRVNVLRMIQDRLYSGGSDCVVKYQKGFFKFNSPVLQIYPHEKQYINIGTSSTVQLFNVNKKVASSKIQVKTKFYKLYQKINKDVYYADNHNFSIIDWRVPYPLINVYFQQDYVDNWISDPYSFDFYQVKSNKLVYINNSKQKYFEHAFGSQIKDYCWKKDKVYFLCQNQLEVFQQKRNQLSKKLSYSLNCQQAQNSILQIKNNLWIYGTIDGKIVVNNFQ